MRRLRAFAALAVAVVALAAAAAGPSWGTRAEQQVDAARRRTLDACSARGIRLPKDFLDWIDRDPVLRTSVYGCRADPLLNYLEV